MIIIYLFLILSISRVILCSDNFETKDASTQTYYLDFLKREDEEYALKQEFYQNFPRLAQESKPMHLSPIKKVLLKKLIHEQEVSNINLRERISILEREIALLKIGLRDYEYVAQENDALVEEVIKILPIIEKLKLIYPEAIEKIILKNKKEDS